MCVCIYVRPPHHLLRHVETTAVRTEGRAGISLPLVWLSCVHSHILTCCQIPELLRSCHSLYLVCPSPFLQFTNTFAPRADAERFVLIMTGLSQWWVCGVACVMSSWQGLLGWRLWRWVVALGEAGLNTTKTVSPGWWKNAKRFAGGVQRINLGNTLAHDYIIVPPDKAIHKHSEGKKEIKWRQKQPCDLEMGLKLGQRRRGHQTPPTSTNRNKDLAINIRYILPL